MKALYFEDQPELAKAIADFLEQELEIHVVAAATPEQALAELRNKRFDLVVLDVRILGADRAFDGKELDWTRYGEFFLDQLRDGNIPGPTPKSVPVLVISCVVSTPDVEKLTELGNKNGAKFQYLRKPVLKLTLVEEAVRALLD